MRPTNPFNPNECPTFLPGDKVYDIRDHKKTLWRIISRIAHWDTELITLRKVNDRHCKRTVLAKTLIPFLKMVTPRLETLAKLQERK